MTIKNTVAILLAALAVAACSSTKEIEVVREVAAPVDPLSDLYEALARSDTYLQSRFYYDGALPGYPRSCSLALCEYLDGDLAWVPLGTTSEIAEQGIEHDRAIAGISIIASANESGDWRFYGAWMDSAVFFTSRFFFETQDGGTLTLAFGEAFGTVSQEPLPVEGTASWQGAMVGQDITTNDRYAGAADLVATFGDESAGEGSEMDVSFTGITNVETGAVREDISFESVTLGLEGTRFVSWQPVDEDFDQALIYIDGRLFGANHQEAAGVFGYNELIGAFGARKQE